MKKVFELNILFVIVFPLNIFAQSSIDLKTLISQINPMNKISNQENIYAGTCLKNKDQIPCKIIVQKKDDQNRPLEISSYIGDEIVMSEQILYKPMTHDYKNSSIAQISTLIKHQKDCELIQNKLPDQETFHVYLPQHISTLTQNHYSYNLLKTSEVLTNKVIPSTESLPIEDFRRQNHAQIQIYQELLLKLRDLDKEFKNPDRSKNLKEEIEYLKKILKIKTNTNSSLEDQFNEIQKNTYALQKEIIDTYRSHYNSNHGAFWKRTQSSEIKCQKDEIKVLLEIPIQDHSQNGPTLACIDSKTNLISQIKINDQWMKIKRGSRGKIISQMIERPAFESSLLINYNFDHNPQQNNLNLVNTETHFFKSSATQPIKSALYYINNTQCNFSILNTPSFIHNSMSSSGVK